MPYFRKKPVVIEAIQFTGTRENYDEICAAFGDLPLTGWPNYDETRIEIKTLEGLMYASVGDWIIRGVEGELYPCKARIFDATYDQVS